jgi:hypothetical protein
MAAQVLCLAGFDPKPAASLGKTCLADIKRDRAWREKSEAVKASLDR